ncbi:Holliday junction resolvase RuvX [Candidatus Berkelbacteria bacterium]|nr:Holliday junction resolvase RuvX [Candidatus Berkelbacteria bacterium]
MRLLGLDVGSKKIGVAVGETIGNELTTIIAPKDDNFYSSSGYNYAEQEISKILREEEAQAIVVGLPVNEQGHHTEESAKIEKFAEKLKSQLKIDIYFVDETLTSFMADEMLESQGIDPQERKQRVHQLAAELILEQYLEDAR